MKPAERAEKERRRYAALSPEERARRDALKREWYLAHRPPLMRRKGRDPAKSRACTKRWLDKHPGVLYDYTRRRRATKAAAPGSHTLAEWRALCRDSGWRCAYCGRDLNEATATRDHVVALSRGGSDSIENIMVACQPCNSSKKVMAADEFRAARCR